MRCGTSWEQHITVIDKVRKKLMGLYIHDGKKISP
jgi:hypothetical protein